jgi:dTDP-4-amino-4,6-dideoxygalactose transaminase
MTGDNYRTESAVSLLAEASGGGRALLTPSCTAALEMTALLLDIAPGDEVIMPSFTFVSTASAFVLRGGVPVFVDIRPDTLNIDESLIEQAITDRTKAIVVVHYAGVGCEMDAICRIAEKHNLPVIEDNAHGLFGKYRGKALGSFGSLATLSFHNTKNFSTGEGGALIVNNKELFERAEIIRDKGTNRSQFFRGMVDKYTWVELGSSYLMSDLLIPSLVGQLEMAETIQSKRRAVWTRYFDGLGSWAENFGASLPTVPTECEPAWHLFYILLPTPEQRDALLGFLNERDMGASFHYLPLDRSPKGAEVGRSLNGCPQSLDVSKRLLRLPFRTDLEESEQNEIIEIILNWEI